MSPRPGAAFALLLTLALATPGLAAAPAAAAAGVGAADAMLREEVVQVPVVVTSFFGPRRLHLEATVYLPDGPGPFPLAVISHGSPREAAARRAGGRLRYAAQSRWFVERGFAVVIPMRRGYAGSDGEWAEGYGSCEEADFYRAGLESARDIEAAVRLVAGRPSVDARRVLLVGQSAGGFGSLAFASLAPEGLLGVVNFAGGRGSRAPGRNCAPERLVQAAEWYGRTVRVPTLWLYAENDSFFPVWLAREMHAAFSRGARAPAELVLLPPFETDGHDVFPRERGMALWSRPVERFLAGLGIRGS